MWKDRQILFDQRKQEDWADVREKARFLIFRSALALMIMAVVLLTAYLSKRWDLPLPLMRSLP